MKRFKGWLYILFLLSSLIFIGVPHSGSIAGDYIFRIIGIPPWSNPVTNQGAHYSTIFGIIMVIISGNLTIKYYKKRYNNYVGRTVVISCLLFIYVYPLLTEQIYYLAYRNQQGLEVVDFLKKDSHCMYNTQEDVVSMQCSIRLINYGGHNENLSIRPIIQEYGDFKGVWSVAEVQFHEISLKPRTNQVYNIHFDSKSDDRIADYGASGSTDSFGIELLQEGQRKIVFR